MTATGSPIAVFLLAQTGRHLLFPVFARTMETDEKRQIMAVREELLNELASHPETWYSGEMLAMRYNVSRTAVWKAVKALQNSGYTIESSPAKGYRFVSDNDTLSAELVQAFCPQITAPVHVYDVIDSTNNKAKMLAASACQHGTLVLADEQTAGRGRQGHSFYSPKKTGLYFSLIAHPEDMRYISRITPAAAVSAAEAIAEVTGIHPGIKWVNDLFLEDRKIAGILTEAITDFETGKIHTVVIGIGINCSTEVFPEDIRDIASSLHASHISRSRLAAVLRRQLLYHLSHLDDPALMEAYRKDSIVLGHEVTYIKNGTAYTGTAAEINDEGNLLVEFKDGSMDLLQSGEISIRRKSL